MGSAEVAVAAEAAGEALELRAAGVADIAAGSLDVGAGLGAEAAVAATKRTRRPTRKTK
jgi:hypothetical protein